MKIWARIKRLSLSGLFQFGWLFITHPLLISPTIKATKRTFELCNNLYGNEHHKSNKANAFRHVLWNVLLCQKTLKRTKNKKKSIIFTEKVTVLYEKATKNDILDEVMDLHNNKIGRLLFLTLFDLKEAEIIKKLQNLSDKAQKVNKIDDIRNHTDQLVFISD